MFGWRRELKQDTQARIENAEAAIAQSQEEFEAVQALRPDVEATVRGHFKLLADNHFSERMRLAYRGEA